MTTVIKGTRTIEEYKQQKSFLEERAAECAAAHRAAVEAWQDGSIQRVWQDSDNNICIRYESGNWWHYNANGEWW